MPRKAPDRRYGSARELADDLGRFLNYEPIHARPVSRTRRLGVWVRKRPWVVVTLALLGILGVSLLAQSFYLENRQQRFENLYREARIERLELAQQPAPDSPAGGPLRPGAERALVSLRQAAELRSDGRLYEEALDVLLVEHRGGERIYPKPGAKPELPREWANIPDLPQELTLSTDGKELFLPGVILHLDTNTATRLEGPFARVSVCDPTGSFLARSFEWRGVEVVERATSKVRFRIDPQQPREVWRSRFSADGRLFAVVTGVPDKAHRHWTSLALEVWEVSAGRRLASIPLPDDELPAAPEFSGDSRFVAWIAPSEIRIYAVATGELTSTIPAPSVGAAALSRDGSTLAWSSGFSTRFSTTSVTSVHVVMVSSDEPIRELRSTGPIALVRLAYTPDGKLIIGQTECRVVDTSYISHGRTGQEPVFHEHTDRVCIWDATDGQLVAWVRGRAFADGFGPRGELAVARAQRLSADADLEIDLWRPAELVEALEQEGLTAWVHPSERDSQRGASALGRLIYTSVAGWLLAITWMVAIGYLGVRKRITTRWASIGIALALGLVGIGVYCFMAVVAEFAGRWDMDNLVNPNHLVALVVAIFGVGNLFLAHLTGTLAIKTFAYAVYGEGAALFEVRQATPKAVRKQQERVAQLPRRLRVRLLAPAVSFAVVAYLDGSFFMRLLAEKWHSGLWGGVSFAFTLVIMFAVTSQVPLGFLYGVFALAEATWDPAKRRGYIAPPGIEEPWFIRIGARVANLLTLGRTATMTFWLVVLLAGLGTAAFELHARLASGNWPCPIDLSASAAPPNPTRSTDIDATLLLAAAVFYVLLSLVRLVRMLRVQDKRGYSPP
jgi:hypothetical protein